jgi:type IV fimbrial biogenesis protein FimT
MNRQRGFTLVELMIGLAIAAIVLSLGVPNFVDLIRNNRMTSQINELVAALNLARSEAIKRGQSINITSASGGSNWKSGWTVEVTAGGEDIRLYGVQDGSHTLTADGGQSVFTYDSQGFLSSSCAANCTITLCESGETGRRMTIYPSGHASVDGGYACP